MTGIHHRLRQLVSDESGQNLIEYALIALLIALASIAAMSGLAGTLSNQYNHIASSI